MNSPRGNFTRVVKLGGSLLKRKRLVDEVNTWLLAQRSGDTLMVVGGGAMVDAVRELDSIRQLPSDEVHWLCVDLLHISYQTCSFWFPSFDSLEDPESLRSWLDHRDAFPAGHGRVAIVSPRAFYRRPDSSVAQNSPTDDQLTSPSCPLPLDWRTTTDSIAAWFAKMIQADELVIWKSCVIPDGSSITSLVTSGVLDEAFVDSSTGEAIYPVDKTLVCQLAR